MTQSKKRPIEGDDAPGPAAKKHRKGFRVGPENLPDGAWRRKGKVKLATVMFCYRRLD